ncbi:M48 family metallopeptidase [Hymenobacter nivis]|uniref:M48 family peptidase n=1 Tax=Hymenobacter nivis TaxID=1850093 RepID=A0A502GVM1_9BACT|nr:M48 family metallopeptidase [Hymenobacter nivis]TPG66437.1 M48 family peptidase [Hymenobacter nivis]
MLRKTTLLAGLVLLASCATVPITGRRQLSLVSGSEMNSLATTQYRTFITENKLSNNSAEAAMVKRVGERIQHAVEQYVAQNNMQGQLDGYQWEFNLVDNKEVNAWCMPGGKVVVYTGILPLTRDENGLAVVLGHEISHAVARHGAERMSDQLVAQGLSTALSTALSQNPTATKSLFMQAVGVGSQVGMLKFSRTQESEADHLGLIFMAMAGYDPKGALPFWQRMAAQNQSSTPEFLSDHPADATRIADIERLLPEAQKYYKPR